MRNDQSSHNQIDRQNSRDSEVFLSEEHLLPRVSDRSVWTDGGSRFLPQAVNSHRVEEQITNSISCRAVSGNEASVEIDVAVAVRQRVQAPIGFSVAPPPRKYLTMGCS